MSREIAFYGPTWQSLQRYSVPEWFRDAKLGIFIHWGVYAVPAYENEWYPRLIYVKNFRSEREAERCKGFREHHVATWGDLKSFGYKDFIPMFKAEKWDPAVWAELFARSGARYVVPVGEHHDGFPMYATNHTRWNASSMGPCRDVCAELAAEVRRAGLKFGISSHRAFNWRYYEFDDAYDTVDPDNAGLYGPAHAAGQPESDEFLEDWGIITFVVEYEGDRQKINFDQNAVSALVSALAEHEKPGPHVSKRKDKK